jgi:hypothetical protein
MAGQRAIGLYRVAVNHAVEAVCGEQRAMIVLPQQRVDDALPVEQGRNRRVGVNPKQSTGTTLQRQVAAVGIEIVLHAAQPQPAMTVATGFVGTIALDRIGHAQQRQLGVTGRGTQVKTVDAAGQRYQCIALRRGDER